MLFLSCAFLRRRNKDSLYVWQNYPVYMIDWWKPRWVIISAIFTLQYDYVFSLPLRKRESRQSKWPYRFLCIFIHDWGWNAAGGIKSADVQLGGLFMCCCRKQLDLPDALMLPSLQYSFRIFLTQSLQVVVCWCKQMTNISLANV